MTHCPHCGEKTWTDGEGCENGACMDAIWDAQAIAARDEFRKVECILPVDRAAHPFSGMCGEY